MTKYRIIEEKTEEGSKFFVQKYIQVGIFHKKWVWEDVYESCYEGGQIEVNFDEYDKAKSYLMRFKEPKIIVREEIEI
jgi:hypothetical protein